jgi:hypothetical protein
MQNTAKLVTQASKLLTLEDWSELDCAEFKAGLDAEADWAREVLVLCLAQPERCMGKTTNYVLQESNIIVLYG